LTVHRIKREGWDFTLLFTVRGDVMTPFRTIVVALDFSETSRDALQAALELARQRHGRVRLLHVVPDVFRMPWMVEAPGIDFADLQLRSNEEAQERLSALAASLPLPRSDIATAVVVGTAALEIVRYANEHAADVIVLGSHGQGLVKRYMLGSVAERVIRQAGCPVLVVPHRTLRPTSFEVQAASGVES
jgi:nucleotide-binding universal stress UspA family protein